MAKESKRMHRCINWPWKDTVPVNLKPLSNLDNFTGQLAL